LNVRLEINQHLNRGTICTQMLHEETNGNAVITTGVGQHQMWAAQWYDYDQPRHWATSGAALICSF